MSNFGFPFMFPADAHEKAVWLEKLGLKEFTETVSKYARIWSIHFEGEAFEMKPSGKIFLRKGARPLFFNEEYIPTTETASTSRTGDLENARPQTPNEFSNNRELEENSHAISNIVASLLLYLTPEFALEQTLPQFAGRKSQQFRPQSFADIVVVRVVIFPEILAFPSSRGVLTLCILLKQYKFIVSVVIVVLVR
ncbi:hypothetical protein JTB14_001268 [Gonioctena quinquepunctata]|nr:hypothetical protein JTB14_001268 [Gonioctena quinquepunctata]